MAEKRSGSPHDCLMISASLTSCAGNADITAAMSGSSVSSSAFQRRVPTPSSPIRRELFAHRGRAGATVASTWSIPVTIRDRVYEQNLRNAALAAVLGQSLDDLVLDGGQGLAGEIGRASCRERVEH